MSSTF